MALLPALVASCAASSAELEHDASLVQPSAGLASPVEYAEPADPADPIEPTVAPSSTTASAPAPDEDGDDDDDRSWFEVLLFGPGDEPEGVDSIDPRMDDDDWHVERETEAERAALAGIFRAEEGWYIGPMYAFTQHNDSDLDGQQFLAGPADTIVLPDIDVGSGPGIVFGYRFETMAFELRYLKTEHDGQWLGNDFNVTYESFGFDFKHFFWRDQRLQPFLMLGFSSPMLEIENGSFSGAAVEDGELEDDIGVEVGGGLGLYLTPRIFVGGHAMYRFETYTEAEGVAPQGPIENVDGGGFMGAITLTYTL